VFICPLGSLHGGNPNRLHLLIVKAGDFSLGGLTSSERTFTNDVVRIFAAIGAGDAE
jgi:hypothetical protein